MPKPRWTDEEHQLLDTYYPRYGAIHTANILARKGYKRTPKSIQCKADERLLYRSAGKKLVPLVWAAPVTHGSAYYQTIEDARAAGVLKVAPGNPKYWVPDWYADQLAQTKRTSPGYGRVQDETIRVLQKRGPTMTRTVAKALGVSVSRASSSLRRLEGRGVVKRYRAHDRHSQPPSVWSIE